MSESDIYFKRLGLLTGERDKSGMISMVVLVW